MSTHTFMLDSVKSAVEMLIIDNASTLIHWIYQNMDKEPYVDPVVRVGLVQKILLKTQNDNVVDSDILEPVVDDLNFLLKSSKDPKQVDVYREELSFIKQCSIHSDMVTLNTNRNLISD